MCNEYRTYLADVVFKKVLHAQQSLLDLQNSISNIEQEMLRCRDTITNFNGHNVSTPSLENSESDSFEFTDDENELTEIYDIEESTGTFEMSDSTDRSNQIIQFQTIIDRVSFLEFDKIDYPGDKEIHGNTGVSNTSAFQRLKQKYLS